MRERAEPGEQARRRHQRHEQAWEGGSIAQKVSAGQHAAAPGRHDGGHVRSIRLRDSPEPIAEYFGATFAGETLRRTTTSRRPTTCTASSPTATAPACRGVPMGSRAVWAKDAKIGSKMINARAETIADKPAFKGVFRKHRCLIPMDGFYEWQAGATEGAGDGEGQAGQAAGLHPPPRRRALTFAGLWSAWRGPDGRDRRGTPWLHSSTVVTTSANGTIRPLHDRMPVILPRPPGPRGSTRTSHDLERLASSSCRPPRPHHRAPGQYRPQQRAQRRSELIEPVELPPADGEAAS